MGQLRRSRTKKLSKDKADTKFALWVRKRDTDYRGLGRCCTCRKWFSFKMLDCGHFISREKEATRYDERNSHAQCKGCNRFKNGKQFAHGLFIDEKYGDGTAKELYQKSRMPCNRTQDDYERIAQKYHDKLQKI